MTKILRPKQVASRIAVSLPTLYRLIKKGDFVQKIHLSAKAVGFSESDVNDWLEKRKEI